MGLFSWLKKKQKEVELVDPIIKPTSKVIDLSYIPTKEELGNAILDAAPNAAPKLKIKAILSNKTLSVFLPGGDVIVNNNSSREMLRQVLDASTEAAIRQIMLADDVLDVEEINISKVADDEKVMEALPDLLDTGEFKEKDGALYLIGIDLSIPSLLAREIIKAGGKESSDYYDALKNFWCWCALNPDPVAREDIFGFLERGDFKITKNGFFLGYRNVVKIKDKDPKSQELVEFISSKYLNIKTKQKKSPKNFSVVQKDGIYDLFKHNGTTTSIPGEIGNLAELYNGLSAMEDNEYTDARTHSTKIRIGQAVKMERKDCDNDPHSECSRGLHVGNKRFGYQSFGSTTIVVAINPMNVVAIPKHDADKMRTCEYFPLGVVTGDKDFIENADSLALEEVYFGEEVDNLINIIQGKTLTEKNLNVLINGGRNLAQQVVNKLEEYQTIINQRVIGVK